MLPNILPPANERVFALHTLHQRRRLIPTLFDLIDAGRGPELFITADTARPATPRRSWPFGCTSMLMPRTQDFVENFADERQSRTQTLHDISKVELLLLTHNCPTCLGDTRMSSQDTKKIRGASFCIIVSFFFFLRGGREGGAGASDPRSVSKSFCLSFKCKPCSIIHEGEQE